MSVALIVALVLAGAGLVPLLAISIPAAAVSLAVTIPLVARYTSLRPSFHFGRWWQLLRESVPWAVISAVNIIYLRVAIVLMSLIAAAIQTGYFAISFRIMEVLIGIPGMVIAPIFPILARAEHNDHIRFSRTSARLFELSLLMATWLVVCVEVGAAFGIHVLGGAKADPAIPVLRIQALSLIGNFMAMACGFPLLIMRRYRQVLIANLMALVDLRRNYAPARALAGGAGRGVRDSRRRDRPRAGLRPAARASHPSRAPAPGRRPRGGARGGCGGRGRAAAADPPDPGGDRRQRRVSPRAPDLPPTATRARGAAGRAPRKRAPRTMSTPPQPHGEAHRRAVSAVVLNYNGRRLLEIVLPSLAMQEHHDFETVVVDDCSTDDSIDYLREHWPQVRVVPTGPTNVGVARALNIAVRSARGELVALLNNDIELDPRWLGEMVAALKRHPDASSASCKLLNYWRRGELDGAGRHLHPRGHRRATRPRRARPRPVQP